MTPPPGWWALSRESTCRLSLLSFLFEALFGDVEEAVLVPAWVGGRGAWRRGLLGESLVGESLLKEAVSGEEVWSLFPSTTVFLWVTNLLQCKGGSKRSQLHVQCSSYTVHNTVWAYIIEFEFLVASSPGHVHVSFERLGTRLQF